MNPTPLPPVAETVRLAGLKIDEAELNEEGLTPRDFLGRLLDRAKFGDAAQYLAFALPKQEAVWWACRCARLAPGAPGPDDKTPAGMAILAAENWLREGTEEARREAGAAGEAVVGTPGGCAALAAFWSGGSLAPKGLPDVPPAEDLTARGVAGAVLLSGVIATPEHAAERYRSFIEIGLAVAEGSDRWTAAAPLAAKPAPVPPQPRVSPQTIAPPPSPAPPASPRPTTSSRYRDTWE